MPSKHLYMLQFIERLKYQIFNLLINLSILLIHVIVISRWHRLGISVKGNSVTAIIDCKKQQNREIKREAKDTIIHDGIILLAQQIDDNTFFEVCFFLFLLF